MRGIGARALAGLACAMAAACAATTPTVLTVEQIVDRNAAARGGLEVWRNIHTMVWTGRIESGVGSAPASGFVLEFKRPNKSRFEIQAHHEKTVRVFDGTRGWKQGWSDGAPTLRPYSRLEVQSAHEAQGIDGLLIDHAAKGIEVALGGTDQVEGRSAYRLNLKLPSGSTRQVWVDAQTFLELRSDRAVRTRAGRARTVSLYYRSYTTVDGLQVPRIIEASDGNSAWKWVIDEVTLNSSLSDAHFEKPQAPQRRNPVPGYWASAATE